MFKIYYQFHESPKDLIQLNNPISQSVKAWQIRFLGHCLQRLQEDRISEYALYHLTNGKPRPGGRKILSHEYAAKLMNPENPPPPPAPAFLTKLEAHGGWLLAPLGTPWGPTPS